MANFYIFIAALAMVHCGSQATDSHCSSDSRSVGLSVSSTKNDSGQWTDLFSARTEHSSALHSITMDVLHNITECDGRRVIHIQGSIRKASESEKEMVFHSKVGSNVTISNNNTTIEKKTDESEKGMVFHSRVGANVIISNNGTTIEKKDIGDRYNGTAFTSRSLENDELFEVILDRKGSKWGFGFGIGVSTVRPEDYEFPPLASHSPHAWMYIGTSIWSNGLNKRLNYYIYSNGNLKRSNYGVDIDKLPAGTRLGVMRQSSSGDIHFYINGEDQGSALSGISGPTYGVADLRGNAEKITILNP